MNVSIVLTVICDDRPGIVENLSKLLKNHQGNWTESAMQSLAGKFAGILLASVPEAQSDEFMASVRALDSAGLHIVVQRAESNRRQEGSREFRLDLVGQDRPGIIHDISTILSRHHINVHELETECQSASMSGESLFLAKAHIQVPPDTSLEVVRQELEALANELMVDLKLEG